MYSYFLPKLYIWGIYFLIYALKHYSCRVNFTAFQKGLTLLLKERIENVGLLLFY